MFYRIIFFVFFTTLSSNVVAQDFVKTQISEFATIEFPLTPEINNIENQLVFVVKDATAFYMVVSFPSLELLINPNI